jgi:hypothetical protein
MKKLVGLAIAGALAAGQQAYADNLNVPSSGGTDLWLFVSDQAKSTTFAVDTGVTVSSLLSSYTSNASLLAVNDAFSKTESQLSGSGNALSSYLNTTDTLEYAVVGMNWPSASTSTSNPQNQMPGGTVGIMSAPTSEANNVKNMGLNNLATWGNDINGDMGYVILTGPGGAGYVSGGSTYAFANGSTVGQVWGGTPGGASAGSTNEYLQGPQQAGITPGTSETLYAVTGNGNNGTLQSYVLGSLKLDTDGSLTLTSSPVPLPAAVWLFGSGLLGLAGVSRRRMAAANGAV